MRRRRELVVTDLLALVLLSTILLAGWWDAALFGLAVLVIMNLIVLIRERSAGSRGDGTE